MRVLDARQEGSGRRSRKWLATGVIVSGMLLALGGPALASPPTVIHDRIVDEFTDPNFCGTGMTVEVAVEGVQNLRPAADSFRATGQVRTVITNPANGNSVVVSAAGQFDVKLISGDPSGIHTLLVTIKGLPAKIQTAHGAVLLRDAGIIAFADTFDGDQFVSSEVVVNKGPHPEADSGFTLFCGTVVSALT